MDLKENRLSVIIEEIMSNGQVEIKSLSKKSPIPVRNKEVYREIQKQKDVIAISSDEKNDSENSACMIVPPNYF